MEYGKKLWTFALLLAAVLLAACAAPTAAPTPPPATDSAVGSTAAQPLPTRNRPYPAGSTDFTQLGITGRPQFLNAYATW